jgi:hypothetical protein
MERMHYPFAHDNVEMLRLQIEQAQQAAAQQAMIQQPAAAQQGGYEAFLQ